MQIPARISSSRISGDQLQQVLIEAQTHCGTTLSCECIAGGLGGNGGQATGATWQSHSNASGGWLARGWRAVTGWSRLQAPSSGRRPKGSQASTAPAGQKRRHGISALISFRVEPGGCDKVADAAAAAVRAAVVARAGRIDGDTAAFGTRAVLVTVSLLSGPHSGQVLSQANRSRAPMLSVFSSS
jgi:hypothetical protein